MSESQCVCPAIDWQPMYFLSFPIVNWRQTTAVVEKVAKIMDECWF